MPVALLAEDPGGGLDLGGRGDEVGLQRLPVGVEPAGADRLALAEARVDDHAVERAEIGAKPVEHGENAVVLVHIEAAGDDGDARVGRLEFGGQPVQPVGAPRAEREVAAAGRELPGHALAEARAGAGDQDVLPQDHEPDPTGW